MSGDVAAPVRLPRDAAYLREHYLQWLRCRSRQRWLMLASLLLALAGAASLLWQPSARPLLAGPVALLALAAVLLWLMPVFEFHRWKRAAQGGLPAMPDLVLETRDGEPVFGAGDAEAGGVRLPIRGQAVRAGHGVFLYVEGRSGRCLYLPGRWLAREDVRRVLGDRVRAPGRAGDGAWKSA